jgi:CBS domain containing-hemolysin-like protein
LHLKDVLPAVASGQRNITAHQLMRNQMVVVPDTHRCDELLQQLRARREAIAIVLDEYGGTAGLVTLNDLLSELVGEIGDSSNSVMPDIEKTADGSVIINGLTTLGDVSEMFNLILVDPNYDTIGGFVMGKLGRIPRVGDEVELDAGGSKFKTARLHVEEMDNRRVAKLRLITSNT